MGKKKGQLLLQVNVIQLSNSHLDLILNTKYDVEKDEIKK